MKVDTETGKVDLVHITTAHECGKVINPIGLEGQVEGASVMAAGWALTEDLQTRNGKVLNDNFRDYKLLLAEDVPQMTLIEVETYEPEGPYGAKEAGEGLTIPTGGAIANAIYNAVGVRIKEMPITPEKVLRALEQKAAEERENREQVVA